MSVSVKCPKCSADNSSSSKYCTSCGNAFSLTRPASDAPLQIPVYPGKFPTGALDHELVRLQPKQSKELGRSKTGLALIVIGFGLTPVPIFAVWGGLAIIVGAIFVFLGRRSLGARHQRYATRSFIVLVAGLLTGTIGTLIASFLFALAIGNSTVGVANILSNFFLWFYAIIIVSDTITNVGLVYLTYDIQDPKGRGLLWSAFTLEILVNVFIAFVVVLNVQATSKQVVAQVSSFADAFSALQNSFAPLRLLLWISTIPFAIAYYRARSRVDQLAVAHARAADASLGGRSSPC